MKLYFVASVVSGAVVGLAQAQDPTSYVDAEGCTVTTEVVDGVTTTTTTCPEECDRDGPPPELDGRDLLEWWATNFSCCDSEIREILQFETDTPTGSPIDAGSLETPAPTDTPTKAPVETDTPTRSPEDTREPTDMPVTAEPSKAPITAEPSKAPVTSEPTGTPSTCTCPNSGDALVPQAEDDWSGFGGQCPGGGYVCVTPAGTHNGIFQYASELQPGSTVSCTPKTGNANEPAVDVLVSSLTSTSVDLTLQTQGKVLTGVYVGGDGGSVRASHESCAPDDWLCFSKLNLVELSKYLLVGTMNTDNGISVNVQNGDLGADVLVLSRSGSVDNVGANLEDTFSSLEWVNVDNTALSGSDYLPGAADLREGVSWTGDVALTSSCGTFDSSNTEIYGQMGVTFEGGKCDTSTSNSYFWGDGDGDGWNRNAAGRDSLNSHLNYNQDMSALRTELHDLHDFVVGLKRELLWSGPDSGKNGLEDVDYYETNLDALDINGDGIAVIDLDCSNDWKVNNANWVIESTKGTFGVFRLVGGKNLLISNGSIMAGDGTLGNKNAASGSGYFPSELRAIFVKASEYEGGKYDGTDKGGSDAVFSFSNAILGGVGFYDLIDYDVDNVGTNDNGGTELSINNGQGCAQFVAPKISFNNVRFELCAAGAGSGQSYEFGGNGYGCEGSFSAPNNEDLEYVSLCVADCSAP